MATSDSDIYQRTHGVHTAIADLVRAGMSGDGAKVEALARGLVENPPKGIRERSAFSADVLLAISNAMTTRRGLTRTLRADTSDGLVEAIQPSLAAQTFVFNGQMHDALLNLTRERAARSRLAEAGLEPVSKILLSGPPGVGKTMSAHWLAGHLGIPLIVLDLGRTVSSYLGESGRNIQSAFAQASATESVFLIDEFDALAKRRDDSSDIGELKRLVNVLLLELDSWSGSSLLVAATNHSQLLDPAIQRRFDLAIEVELPSAKEISAMLVEVFHDDAPDKGLVALAGAALVGMSNSDVVRFCRSVYRTSIVKQVALPTVLLERLAELPPNDRAIHEEIWRRLKDDAGMSSRTIAQHANLSHPTINTGINQARGRANGRVKQPRPRSTVADGR